MKLLPFAGGSRLQQPRRPAHSPVRPLLLCFSHLRWNFVFQRPQHLMTRAAVTHDVIYIEEPVDSVGLAGWLIAHDRGVTIATPQLPPGGSHEARVAAQARLLDALLDARVPDIAWYYTPMALEFSDTLVPAVTVYDNMDELALFHGADSRIRLTEARLMARADVVFTGGHGLYQAKRTLHDNIHPVPSSIDRTHFARDAAVPLADPADQAGIAHPRVGFFGVIDERMDLDLVAAIADRCPDTQFVLIGPVVKIDPASRPQRPNLHWLGGKAYADLPAYLQHWDCGFMPFALNDATRYISPTKTPEFLSARLGVVSTAITDAQHPYADLGLVGLAADADGFALAIDVAMTAAADPGWQQRVQRQLASGSWDSTWAFMRSEITALAAPARETAHA